MSHLLKKDWPRSLEELEARRQNISRHLTGLILDNLTEIVSEMVIGGIHL